MKKLTTEENMQYLFDGRRTVLFLENDYGLYHGLDKLEKYLIENKIKYNALYNLKQLPIDYVIDMCGWYDIIVFQSQFVYEISHQLRKHFLESKTHMTFLEVPVGDPTFYYLPKDTVHDIYTLKFKWDGEWNLYKLREDKASWDD